MILTGQIGEQELRFYGDRLVLLQTFIREITEKAEQSGYVEHIKYRIKSVRSIQAKLERKGLEFSRESAFENLYDLAGVRLICKYADEIEKICSLFEEDKEFEIIRIKDYINNPKPNGYRSFHIVIKKQTDALPEGQSVFAEIQIRTISMDSWASLEHQLKYKQQIKDEAMIVSELKKCADEMYSSEISLMTLRDLISKY